MDFDFSTLREGLILYLLLATSLCLRAYAQAWMADKMGDHTPRLEGRLTSNPLPHIDLLGTVIMPLVFIFYLQPSLSRQNLTLFLGWAKPVPMNPSNFSNPRRGIIFTQFSGMGMSLLLCLLAAVFGGILFRADPAVVGIFTGIIAINSCLIVFDCLPLPPLPGGVLLRQLGYISEETFMHIARWSGLALIILINIRPCAMVFGILRGLVAFPFMMLMEMIAR